MRSDLFSLRLLPGRVVRTARMAARTPVRAVAKGRWLSWERLPKELVLRYGYNVMLKREPDEAGTKRFLPALVHRYLDPVDFLEQLRGSEEFEVHTPMTGEPLGPSLHASRCRFIRSLPRARRILDLGGSHANSPLGALLLMGYPYEFESVTIVDLAPDERHPLYRSEQYEDIETKGGPVRYAYHSMTDLGRYDDDSFDLVYSGQSIEHISPDEGAAMCKDVLRILRPGGWFALDTPNGAITRLQSDAFIDPDHEVEYTAGELSALLSTAGFEIIERKGLNYAGRCAAAGTFSGSEVATNMGVYADAESCYLLAFVAQKPDDADPAG